MLKLCLCLALPYDGSIFGRSSSAVAFGLDSNLNADTVTGQYLSGSTFLRQSWVFGDTIDAARTSYIFNGLNPNTDYNVRFVYVGSAGNVTISQTYGVNTCAVGFQGVNCEGGKAIMTTFLLFNIIFCPKCAIIFDIVFKRIGDELTLNTPFFL